MQPDMSFQEPDKWKCCVEQLGHLFQAEELAGDGGE